MLCCCHGIAAIVSDVTAIAVGIVVWWLHGGGEGERLWWGEGCSPRPLPLPPTAITLGGGRKGGGSYSDMRGPPGIPLIPTVVGQPTFRPSRAKEASWKWTVLKNFLVTGQTAWSSTYVVSTFFAVCTLFSEILLKTKILQKLNKKDAALL